MPRVINSGWQPYWFLFQNGRVRKLRNLLCFISFDPHEIFWWFWCLVWCFLSKGIWIWCSADNNISNWWIFFRSGSKIRLKKSFQSYFLLSNHISATGDLWKCFLKSSFIWMQITRSTIYYLLPWPPHWIYNMANHGLCDGKCHPSQLWLLQFFLQTSHI